MTEEDEEWAQTSITITPEDDAVIREIADTTLLSARSDVPLEIGPEDIVHRQPLASRQLMDPEEERTTSSINLEEQTGQFLDSGEGGREQPTNSDGVQEQSANTDEIKSSNPDETSTAQHPSAEITYVNPDQTRAEQNANTEETKSADPRKASEESGEYYDARETLNGETLDNARNEHAEPTIPPIDSKTAELETKQPKMVETVREYKNTETQTYLQGVPEVHLQPEYKDEASQTIYTSPPCRPLTYYKEIMSSMSDSSMPLLQKSDVTMTIIKFHPDASRDTITAELSKDFTLQELEDFTAKPSEKEQMDMEIENIIDFILTCTLWVKDPTSQKLREKKDEGTQTHVRFNKCTKKIVLDNETQTGLTCKPKESNTKLLDAYQDTKAFITNLLDDCFCNGIEPRILVDGIIDKILNECSERIRLPTRDQIAQTVASYKLEEEKEDDILKKLRLERVIDPFEAVTVVEALIDDFLWSVRDDISKNAPLIVNDILKLLLQRTTSVIAKLVKIQQESQPKKIDDRFDRRRQKILKSLSKKATATISTQTGIAGVPEVMKIQESKEIICSICRQSSICRWCVDQESGDSEPQESAMRRTQDILLTYKPCYIVATAADAQKNPDLHPACPPPVATRKLPPAPICISDESSTKSSDTVNVVLQPRRKMRAQDSNSWSRVIETALGKPWSIRGSTSDDTKMTTCPSMKSSVALCRRESSKFGLTSEIAKTLELLKNTFCTKGTCTALSCETLIHGGLSENESAFRNSICYTCSTENVKLRNTANDPVICTQDTCGEYRVPCLTEKDETCDYDKCEKRTVAKKMSSSLKVIPVCFLYNSDSGK